MGREDAPAPTARAFLQEGTVSRLVLTGAVTRAETAHLAAELMAAEPRRYGGTARELAQLLPDVLSVDVSAATSLDEAAVALVSALSSQCMVRGRWLTVVAASGAALDALASAGVADVVLLTLRDVGVAGGAGGGTTEP